MKKFSIILIFALALFSCQDDDVYFDASINQENISFVPFAGGATMNYTMPSNSEIHCIVATYKDDRGNTKSVKGTYLDTSVDLFGFIEGKKDVPVNITLLNRSGEKSKSMKMTFEAYSSSTLTLFDNISVEKYWSGFCVKYDAAANTKGLIHVAYLGMNPLLGKIDTILSKSRPILEGQNTIECTNCSNGESDKNTVVVWTEDYKGNIVKKHVYENIPIAEDEMFDSKQISFHGASEEHPVYELSWKYLFDGDKNGTTKYVKVGKGVYSFVSRSNQVGSFFTLELNEPKVLSKIKFYEELNARGGFPMFAYQYKAYYLAPNKMRVFAGNDKDADLSEWTELGSFYEPKSTSPKKRWNWRQMDEANQIEDVEILKAMKPCYCEINFPVLQEKFRYIRIYIDEVYKGDYYGTPKNTDNRYAFSELELFTEK